MKMKKPYVAKVNKQLNICKLIPDLSELDEPGEIPGFKRVDDLFVDNTGFGRPDEAALTESQFIDKVEKGFAYALTDIGQFQVHIGVYEVC
ncbi:hypothetical protein LCGC14_1426060 [marine sediment metagenome]|uniref:Uncharacterized protein n=1 Tax=marine sediment metagenome TaxID=412755 RepID=A0A0F9MRQ3_9ZZZZ